MRNVLITHVFHCLDNVPQNTIISGTNSPEFQPQIQAGEAASAPNSDQSNDG
jgi:hypothetical protein